MHQGFFYSRFEHLHVPLSVQIKEIIMKRNVLFAIVMAMTMSGCASVTGRSVTEGVVSGVLDHFIGPLGSGILVAALHNATRPEPVLIVVKPSAANSDAGEVVAQAKPGI
ncbi:hypothetical protein WT27_12925 [Burkholderia territorii]|uniref:Uncharacterized protein n=2 Tax=Burkholderia territorii TaxID=1503055 RepID=A0A105V422_9BURK|nr:hypothetical protein WT27_12925 [Burkholderia territorii]